LIGSTIKSKFIPYYIILIIILSYFVIIIPVNFFINKKVGNKLYFVYSIPIISIIFLALLVSLNILYKWFDDIENKLEVNIVMGKNIIRNGYLLNFTPTGWKYGLIIDEDDFKWSKIGLYGTYRNDNNEINYLQQDNKISIQHPNVISSSIATYNYMTVQPYEQTYFDIQYDNKYTDLGDFYKDYVMDYDEDNKIYIDSTLSETIDYIWVTKETGDYLDKYSFGNNDSNYKLRVDVYVK